MSSKTFSIQTEAHGEVVILFLRGPLSEEAGKQLIANVNEALQSGNRRFVIDFGNAVTIPSPCVAAILETAEAIVDKHSGRLVVSGLTDLNLKVFEMVGILMYAESCNNIQDAEIQASA